MGKNVKANNVKKEIIEEENNKKIVVAALGLALVLALIAYWQISKKNDVKEPKDNKKPESVEKVEDKEDDALSDEKESYISNLEKNTTTETKQVINSTDDDSSNTEDDEEDEIFYSLSFNTNGGEKIEKHILSQTDKTESVLPEREGWSFFGWFSDSELTEEFIFGRVLTADTEIYAKWVKVVEFRTMDDDILIASKEFAENEAIFMPQKEDITNFVDDDHEVAWVTKEIGEDSSVTYTEVYNATKLTDKIYGEKGKIILYLKQLSKFQVQVFMNETSEEPFDVIDAVEDRALDLSVLDEKLAEQEIAEYALFYRNNEGTKFTFFRDQKASLDITKLYLDEAYTVKFADYVEKKVDEVSKEQNEVNNEENQVLLENNNNNEVNNQDDDNQNLVIIDEELVAKDSYIKEEQIPVIEKEDSEFIGWFEDLNDEKTMLTENTIINEDKVYIAKWKTKEEMLEDNVQDNSVSPQEEDKLENTEEPLKDNSEE